MAEFMFPNVVYRATVYRTGGNRDSRMFGLIYFFFQVTAAKVSKQNLSILIPLGLDRVANLVTIDCNQASSTVKHTTYQEVENLKSGILVMAVGL